MAKRILSMTSKKGLVILLPILMLSSCYWGTIDVNLENRLNGTVAFDVKVPYLIKGFYLGENPLLPFPASLNGFSRLVESTADAELMDLSEEYRGEGWNITGSIRFNSIEGLAAICSIFVGSEPDSLAWQENGIFEVNVPQLNYTFDNSDLVIYHRSLLESKLLEVNVQGNFPINGISGRPISFSYQPLKLLEEPEQLRLVW